MTKDQALNVFKKYAHSHFKCVWGAHYRILDYISYSEFFSDTTEARSKYQREDWMGDDFLEACNWMVNMNGRNKDFGTPKYKVLWKENEKGEFVRDLEDYVNEVSDAKEKKKRKSAKKRAEINLSKAQAIVDSMDTGDVAIVKFSGFNWSTRGMKTLEIDDDIIAGFYLDRVIAKVPADAIEKEGFVYSKPTSWNFIVENGVRTQTKDEWDGKTFTRTRNYQTKMIKFVKGVIKDAKIIKE